VVDDLQNNIGGIVVLSISVGIAVMIMILMSSLGGEMYVATEPVIQDIGSDSVTSLTYSDTFEDDTVNLNPSDSWYSYSEVGWSYANVSSE
jgi:hypothetical protein